MPQHHTPHSTLYKALPNWLETLNFTHFVTLTFNQRQYHRPDQILEYARDKIKFFHSKLDRCLLGSDFYKKPTNQRTLFVAFPEKIQTNMHYHILMRIAVLSENKFNTHAENIWTSIMPSGTYDCKVLRDAYDEDGLVSYAVKEQFKNVNFNHTIISSEFLNI